MSEQVWLPKSGNLYLVDKQRELPSILENGVYELEYHELIGFSIKPISENFEFPYKIYGLETDIINRTLKYYNNTTSGNLGVLLNGIKGTGKTVTSKIICNKLNMPVILIANSYSGAEDYINSIPQNIVVFIDEYEKIYNDSHDFLTIMDGALNSMYRRVFLMTTNNLHIDSNLIDRPSRVRYLKTFDNLSTPIVAEIVDDVLKYPQFREDCIHYISTLEIITVDIVKAIINEVNIQEESPMIFKSVFNASVKKGKYKVFVEEDKQMNLIIRNCKISPRLNFGDRTTESYFYINDNRVGDILEVIDFNTIKVQIEEYEEDEDEDIVDELTTKRRGKQIRKPKMVTPFNLPKGIVTIVVQEDYVYNETYKYGNRDFSEMEGYGYGF